MNARRVRVIAAWLTFAALAAVIVARARYITDLSAFLPENPTPMQRLLVDQLREGPASRVILIALERGDTTTSGADLRCDGAPLAPRSRVFEHRKWRTGHGGTRSGISIPAPLSIE